MADMMYRLVLRAQFENAEELQKATQALEQIRLQGANVKVELGKMQGAGKTSMEDIARGAMSVGFMFNMMESAMMRSEMATILVTNAQERYNTVVGRFGSNSEEARKAGQELEQQMKYLEMANMRTSVSMGIMATNLLLQSGLLDKATLSTIYHTVVTKGAAAAHWLENAALGVKASLLAAINALTFQYQNIALAIGAAAAIGVAGYAVGSYAANAGQTISINAPVSVAPNLDEALVQQNKKITSEYNRMRP